MTEGKKAESKVIIDTAWTMAMNYFAAITGIIYFSFASRILPTAEDLGLLSFATILSLLVLTLGTFALPQAAVKALASMRKNGIEDIPRKLFGILIIIGVFLGIMCGSLIFLRADYIAEIILGLPDRVNSIRLLALNILPVILKEFIRRSLQGAGKLKEAAISGIGGFGLRNSISIIFLLQGWGVEGILIGWICGDTLDCVIGLIFIVKTAIASSDSIQLPFREISRFCGPLYSSNVLNYAEATIDRYFILWLISATALGFYSPAITGANLIGMIPVSVTASLFPTFARIASQRMESLKYASSLAQKWLFLFFLPIAIGLAVESSAFIEILAGPSYLVSAPALAILAVASGITCHYAIVESILLGTGRTRLILMVNIIGLIVIVSSSWYLIRFIGIFGAAISRALLQIARLAVATRFAKTNNIYNFQSSHFIKPLSSALLMAIIVKTLQFVFGGIQFLLLRIVIGIVIYLIALRFLKALTPDDFEIIRYSLPEKLQRIIPYVQSLLLKKDEAEEHVNNEFWN